MRDAMPDILGDDGPLLLQLKSASSSRRSCTRASPSRSTAPIGTRRGPTRSRRRIEDIRSGRVEGYPGRRGVRRYPIPPR